MSLTALGSSDRERSPDPRQRSRDAKGLPPILAVVILALVPLVNFRQLVHEVGDPDVFWHLRLGRYVLDTWAFSGPDPFSTYADEPLVLHEWPLEVVFTTVESTFGFTGLVVLQALFPVLVLGSIYALVRREGAPLVAAPVAVVAWIGTSGTFSLRPQMASFILLALVTAAWLRTASDGRARWWLVPVMWAWASVHGLWIAGIAVGLLVTAGMVLDGPRSWARLRGPLGVLALSIVAAGLTPLGPGLLLKPFGHASDYAVFVTEWGPAPLFAAYTLATVALLVATAVVWARRSSRPTSWVEVLLWVAALGASLLYARTVAVGAVLAAPLAARAVASVVPELRRPRLRTEVGVLVAGLAVFLAAAVAVAPSIDDHERAYPTALEPRLRALPASTHVLNAYELGGWMLWRYPGLDPYVDGREDVYSVEHLARYGSLISLSPGWEDKIADDGVQAALLPEGSPLAAALVDQAGWTDVGRASGYVLVTPSGP